MTPSQTIQDLRRLRLNRRSTFPPEAHDLAVALAYVRGPASPRPKVWNAWPATIDAHRIDFADQLAREWVCPTRFSGRGIITLLGGAKYFPCGWVLCSMLREMGCTLPIQAWCLNRREMDAEMIGLLRRLDVQCVNAEVALCGRPRQLAGWELKVWAMMESPFAEVLFLDSDNIPARDPSYLFDGPEYRRTGAVLWPDWPGTGYDMSVEAFAVSGLEIPDGAEIRNHYGKQRVMSGYAPVDSGQILVDKTRHWPALSIARHINDHSEFWYPRPVHTCDWHIYGDKTSFFIGWHATKSPFFMPQPCGWVGNSTGGAMMQKDEAGEVVLQHRCQPQDKLKLPPSVNVHPKGFQHGASVDRHLAELAGIWSGKIDAPPEGWDFGDGRWGQAIWDEVCVENCYGLPDSLEGQTIIDIGANIGCFVHACMKRGAAKVIAVEACPANFAALVRNCRGWGSRFVPVQAAVCERRGWTQVSNPLIGEECNHGGWTQYFAGEHSYPVLAIDAATIRELCGGSADLMKLDCEGCEWSILENCDVSWVREIVGEWHLCQAPEGRTPEDLGAALERQGFAVTLNASVPARNLGIFRAIREACKHTERDKDEGS